MLPRPQVAIVVATAKNGAIGKGQDLLFRIVDDMKRFKSLTLGHPVIMGRKTWESIPPQFRPLPGRTNIVVTRNPQFQAEGAIVVSSLSEAFKKACDLDNQIFVVGGGEIYKEAIPYTDKLYLTLVESDTEGDIFFPDWRQDFTKETYREERTDEKTGLKYTWIDLERTTPALPLSIDK